MSKALLAIFLLWSLGLASAVAAPESSIRPVARGGLSVEPSLALFRPVARPVVKTAVQTQPTAPSQVALLVAVSSLRPSLRPRAIEEKAMARRRARARGAVCGDPDIQGEAVGGVPGRISGCGIREAVRIREISGVTLSQKALMDCGTAKALNRWVNRSAKPAFRGTGGGLVRLRVAAHYACRTRNNQPGARISEHGKGRAIDISGFVLANGREVTVLRGWGSGGDGRRLRRIHKEACGPFGTVLGPNSDRFHRDHFHFDTARYRSGPYCR